MCVRETERDRERETERERERERKRGKLDQAFISLKIPRSIDRTIKTAF